LLVSDIDKALLVYRDVLGFVVEFIGVDTPDAYSYEIFRIPRTIQTRFATLSSASQQRTLALIEMPGFAGVADGVLTAATVIQVASVDAVLQAATVLGLATTAVHCVLAPAKGPARREAAFYDYDGHAVVIYQLDFSAKSEQSS
jgi:catechol 2,3-dioxygenase-like lactoylglutathione lyase family enzyme